MAISLSAASASPRSLLAHPLWRRLFPFLTWLPQVTRTDLRADLLAGLTGALVVLPQGVAFATIAGMPPAYGLYAGMVPAIVAALFGSSRQLVSGPTTAASIVLLSALSQHAPPGSELYVSLALTLTFMVGAIQLLMGIGRLGTLVNFISHAVIVGFTAGAAILIAINQLKHFVGMDLAARSVPGVIQEFALEIHTLHPWSALVGLTTLAVGILIKRYAPKLPYMIVAIVAGSVLAAILMHVVPGGTHISMVGALPDTLPPLSHPEFDLARMRELAPAALALTLFALTEAVSIAQSLALRAKQAIDGNQEFIGQGLSNLAGSFFSGYVATGSFNRSGLNYEAGARTPLAAVFAGVLLMGVVVLVAPFAAYLPTAAMAGVLFLVAWGLIDFHHIRQILHASHGDAITLAVTFLSALLLNLEFAILAGVILSLVFYLARTSRPHVVSRVPDPHHAHRKFTTAQQLPECPQLKVVRVDGSLFFGAVSHVRDSLRLFERRNPGQRHVAVVAQAINFIDSAGAEFLADEARRRREAGGGLYLIRLKENVRATLARGGYLEEIGHENIFPGKTEAIHAIYQRLDPAICADCPARIFRECQTRAGAVLDFTPAPSTPALSHA